MERGIHAQQILRPGRGKGDRVPLLIPARPLRKFRITVVEDIEINDQFQVGTPAFRREIRQKIPLGDVIGGLGLAKDQAVNPFVVPDDVIHSGALRVRHQLLRVKVLPNAVRPLSHRKTMVRRVLDEPHHQGQLRRTVKVDRVGRLGRTTTGRDRPIEFTTTMEWRRGTNGEEWRQRRNCAEKRAPIELAGGGCALRRSCVLRRDARFAGKLTFWVRCAHLKLEVGCILHCNNE